jgi:hypothetical protein
MSAGYSSKMLVRSQGLGWLAVFAFGELALWAAVPRPTRVATTIIQSFDSIIHCSITRHPHQILFDRLI